MTNFVTHRVSRKGPETPRAIREILAQRGNVELRLPSAFHHALFTHIYPDAGRGAPETVDATAGAELLTKIAEGRGLKAMADLVSPVSQVCAKVRVQSPSPNITITLPRQGSQ